ncbi:MAG: PorP/SprF family type IX secretion system membrane protein [Fulvivirga sp.]|uniref:PorP/SprF family type IX secretion system membrane protein n=2 Tax=Fulvivirga sp. TaxID=1931237 RepID=UPI0032EF8962
MKKILTFFILVIVLNSSFGQGLPRYNHYFTYSYLYNPAFLGSVESSELNMIYRKQWVGLDGAPEYIHAGLQLPLSGNIAIGLNASNFEQGVIMETSAMGSVAYTVNLGLNNTLSFGVSIGAGRSALDVNQITDFSDPAIAGSMDKSFYLEGQAGLSLNLKSLNVSVSLPKIFEKNALSDEDFQEVSLGPLNSTFSSISYRFDISPKLGIEPMGAYRTDNQLEDQWQANTTLYYNNLLWLGGSYSDGYGAAAYAGFQVNDFLKIGYSFDFSSSELATYNSHEFYVSLNLGRKKIDRQQNYIPKEKPLQVNEPKTDTDNPDVAPAKTKEIVEESLDKQIVEDKPAIIEEKVEEQDIAPIEKEEQIAEMLDSAKDESTSPEEIVKIQIDGMNPGYYVVIGAFAIEENAMKYIDQLKAQNYQPQIAHNTRTQYYYVYLLFTQKYGEAQTLRDDLRKRNVLKFEESWILKIN